jgi:hypothetical protein
MNSNEFSESVSGELLALLLQKRKKVVRSRCLGRGPSLRLVKDEGDISVVLVFHFLNPNSIFIRWANFIGKKKCLNDE